jgi:hypothetical protein
MRSAQDDAPGAAGESEADKRTPPDPASRGRAALASAALTGAGPFANAGLETLLRRSLNDAYPVSDAHKARAWAVLRASAEQAHPAHAPAPAAEPARPRPVRAAWARVAAAWAELIATALNDAAYTRACNARRVWPGGAYRPFYSSAYTWRALA